VRLLQITDCHLSANPEWRLAGIRTQTSFEQVLNLATQRWSQYDLAIFTGDLVHDASEVGYQRFKQHLEMLPSPSVCLPGNHDTASTLSANLNGDKVSAPKAVHLGGWLLILLDSTLGEGEKGHIKDEELEWLQSTLAQNKKQNTLICLHHHPVFVGSKWIDRMSLQQPEKLFQVLDQFNQIKGIIWGHIHQTYDEVRQGVQLMSAPSTCIQFIPKQDSFGIDNRPPGYRWLELHPDGTITSGVEHIAALSENLDLESNGY
jgi:Icc protein